MEEERQKLEKLTIEYKTNGIESKKENEEKIKEISNLNEENKNLQINVGDLEKKKELFQKEDLKLKNNKFTTYNEEKTKKIHDLLENAKILELTISELTNKVTELNKKEEKTQIKDEEKKNKINDLK